MADSLIFIELTSAEFKIDINIDSDRYQFTRSACSLPLLTACCELLTPLGLTLERGVVVDLRRAGGLLDDDWWLAI